MLGRKGNDVEVHREKVMLELLKGASQEKLLWGKIQFLTRYSSERMDPALVRAKGKEC